MIDDLTWPPVGAGGKTTVRGFVVWDDSGKTDFAVYEDLRTGARIFLHRLNRRHRKRSTDPRFRALYRQFHPRRP